MWKASEAQCCMIGSAGSSGRTEDQQSEERYETWGRVQALHVRLRRRDFVLRAGRTKQDFFFFLIYVYFFCERESKQAREGQREREREIPSRLHTVSTELDVGLELTNHEIMT